MNAKTAKLARAIIRSERAQQARAVARDAAKAKADVGVFDRILRRVERKNAQAKAEAAAKATRRLPIPNARRLKAVLTKGSHKQRGKLRARCRGELRRRADAE